MKPVICPKCKSVDTFYTESKPPHIAAYCGVCKKFIKFLSSGNPKFYFGKYKDTYVKECNDLNYLEWFIRETKTAPAMREALLERIKELEGEKDNG